MAARNLLRNAGRSWATGSSIAIGLACVLVVFGFIGHLEHWLRVVHIYGRPSGHVALYKPGGLEGHLVHPEAFGFSPEEQRRLAAVLSRDAAVERLGRHLVGTGLVSNGCLTMPFRAVGTEPELDRWLHERPELRAVAPTLARFERGRGRWEFADANGIIGMTGWLAERLGKTRSHDDVPPGQAAPAGVIDCAAPNLASVLQGDANVQLVSATHSGSFAAMDGEIGNWFTTGLVELERDAVSTSLAALQSFYETDQVTYFSVFLSPASAADDLPAVARRLRAQLASVGVRVDAYAWYDGRLSPAYAGGMQFLHILAVVALVIMALLVALTLINSVALAVSERAREIGSLRALGFTVRQVVGMQVRELVLLVLVSEAAGLSLTALVSAAARTVTVRYAVPGLFGMKVLRIELGPAALLGSVLVVFVVAVAACAIAARRQLRRRPIELLQAS